MLIGTASLGVAAMAVAVTATVGSHAGIARHPVKTVVARRASLTPAVTLTGWYQPPAPVHLDAPVSGSLVLDVTVVGQAVHTGEQLGTIADPALAAAVSQAEAGQREANAAVAAARAEVAAQQASDQQAVGQAQRTVTSAQADLAAAQAAQAKATAALSSEQAVTQGAPPATVSALLAPYQQQLATSQASVATAENNLQEARAALGAANETATSDPSVTALTAKLSEAQAAASAAGSQVQQATDALAAATLTSPINGVLAHVLVASGSSVQAGTPVLSLAPAPSSTADFQIFVPQLMGAKVAVGDRVRVPGVPSGSILYVSATLSTYQGAQGFLATASVPRNAASSGATGATTASGVPLQVQVERTTLHHVVVVPLSAIADPYGRTTVSVQSGKVRKQVAVTVIARSASKVAVSGLRPGATVYLLPS